MTTTGIFEIRTNGKSVAIFGRHDSFQDGWPAFAVKYAMSKKDKPAEELASEIVEKLRERDLELYKETFKNVGRDVDESKIRSIADSNFFIVRGETDSPPYEYRYVYDADKDEVVVMSNEPKPCPDRDDISCGSVAVEEFRGSAKEYLKKYLLGKVA